MSWWSKLGGFMLGSGLGSTIEGGRAQKRGLRTSEKALKYGYEHGLAEYAPYGEWGRGGIADYGTALESLNAPISGESPYYKWQSEQGLKKLRQGLAARGQYGSGAGMALEGQFLNQLGAEESLREYQRRMERLRLAQERIGVGAGVAGARSRLWTGQGEGLAEVHGAQGAAETEMYSGLARLPFDVASTYIAGRQAGMWGGTKKGTGIAEGYGGGKRASGAW